MGSIGLEGVLPEKVRVCMLVCCRRVPNIQTAHCHFVYDILIENNSRIGSELTQNGEWNFFFEKLRKLLTIYLSIVLFGEERW
jgi:hypothetical protein